jgi:hypothetical protein
LDCIRASGYRTLDNSGLDCQVQIWIVEYSVRFSQRFINKAILLPVLRTTFLPIAAILVLGLTLTSPSLHAEELRVYVGKYTADGGLSKGIYTCLFDSATGKLTEPTLAGEVVNPTFLAIHPNRQFLYAVNELSEGPGKGDGGVTKMKINADGKLTKLNSQPSFGGTPPRSQCWNKTSTNHFSS